MDHFFPLSLQRKKAAYGSRLTRLVRLPALDRPTPRRDSPARAAVEQLREHGSEAVRPKAVARGREVQEVVHQLDGQVWRAVLRAVLRAATHPAARHAALVELRLELRLGQRHAAQQARAAVEHADARAVGGRQGADAPVDVRDAGEVVVARGVPPARPPEALGLDSLVAAPREDRLDGVAPCNGGCDHVQ